MRQNLAKFAKLHNFSIKKKKKNIQTQVPKILNNLVRTVSPKILLANLAVKSSLLQEDYSKRS